MVHLVLVTSVPSHHLARLFKNLGSTAMGLMVPVLAGYIAYAIADRPGLAVGFTGGLLASNGNAKTCKLRIRRW